MEETKKTDAQGGGDSPAGRTRDEQATSGKTLSDLERTQADPATTQGGGGASDTSSPTEGSSPSPEGDSGRGGRADGGDTGGPM